MIPAPTVRFTYGPFDPDTCDYCDLPILGDDTTRYRLALPAEQAKRSPAAPALVQTCTVCQGAPALAPR